MITPKYLKKGDRIGIISSAKKTDPEEITEGVELLKSWGLVAVLGTHTFNTHHFFAGTDIERTEDLQSMLDDDSIQAIIFTKGAYGTMKIIDALNFDKFKKHPKWIMGYSDITVLHNHIHNLGIETIHSVMLQGIPKASAEARISLQKALFGESLGYEFPQHVENKNNKKAIEGTLVGGNLSVFYALIGSDSDIDTSGKILFIEDIDEYLYHLDRMLISLRRSGKLANLKALVVGAMIDIKESTLTYGQTANEIILEQVKDYDYPVFFDFPSGHQSDNRTLILGREIKVTPDVKTVRLDFKD